jgi:hypothetical protein
MRRHRLDTLDATRHVSDRILGLAVGHDGALPDAVVTDFLDSLCPRQDSRERSSRTLPTSRLAGESPPSGIDPRVGVEP